MHSVSYWPKICLVMKKKLFISHASEDKDELVRPLAEALRVDFDGRVGLGSGLD